MVILCMMVATHSWLEEEELCVRKGGQHVHLDASQSITINSLHVDTMVVMAVL